MSGKKASASFGSNTAPRNRDITTQSGNANAWQSTLLVVRLAFSAYVLAWFWQASRRWELAAILRVELLLGTLLAVIAILSLLTRPLQLRRGGEALIWCAVLLLFLITVQVPFSAGGEVAYDLYVERVIKFGFWAILIAAFVRSPHDLRWFLAAFLVATGYICFEALRGGFFGGLMWQNQGVMRLHGATPLFQHPNSLAGVGVGFLAFAAYVYSALETRWARWLLVLFSFVALLCVMYTGSRTSYLGILALAVFVAIRARWRIGRLIAVGLAAIPLIALMMPAQYQARFETIFTGQEIEGASMDKRQQIIEDSFAVLRQHPLGVGVGGFTPTRLAMFGRYQDTHNLYLQVATHLGLQGLVAFLAFVVVLWRQLGAIARWGSNQSLQAMCSDERWIVSAARAAQAYLFARLVLGLFGHDLYEVYWWVALGLALACSSLAESLDRPDGASPHARGRGKWSDRPPVVVHGVRRPS